MLGGIIYDINILLAKINTQIWFYSLKLKDHLSWIIKILYQTLIVVKYDMRKSLWMYEPKQVMGSSWHIRNM